MEVRDEPELTVVIATRNRADSLERLLDALTRQVGAPPFEVVVADNGSEDRTPAVIAAAATRGPVRGIEVRTPGKGRALNAAFREARGGLIVLTDDDVTPDPRWLAELAAGAARHPQSAVFGGKVEVDRGKVPGWIRRSHNLMGLLTSEHVGRPESNVYGFGRYPFGPNLAVRRDRIAGMDSPYPTAMGPGTPLPVGDESAFLMRVSVPEARDRIFLPEARVRHAVEAEHLTLRNALRRSYQQGQAQRAVGIPVVPSRRSEDEGRSAVGPSFLEVVWKRLAACRSAREALCVVTRQIGYLR